MSDGDHSLGLLSGVELDYVQITANVTISGTSGAQTTVITGSSVIYDGATRIKIAVCAALLEAAANDFCAVELWDGSTDLCEITGVSNHSSGVLDVPFYVERFLTPSAGAHQYIIKAYRSSSNGLVAAGNGVSGNFAPAFLRITRA